MVDEKGVAKNREAYNKLFTAAQGVTDTKLRILYERLLAELRSLSFSEAKIDVLCNELKTELLGDASKRIPGKLTSAYYVGLPFYEPIMHLLRQDEERVSVFDQEYNVLLKFAIDVAEVVKKNE